MTSDDRVRTSGARLGHADIVGIAGNIEDAKAAAIAELGATAAQLEDAVAWASGLSGDLGKEGRKPSALVCQLYDILTADEDFGDERAQS